VKKFEAVEKEYETVAELAKEDELELRYVFFFFTLFVVNDLTGNLTCYVLC